MASRSNSPTNRHGEREIYFQRPLVNTIVNTSNQRIAPNSKIEMGTQASIEEEKHQMDDDSSILDFSKPFLFSDVTLICAGRKLHCHRVILALFSPVFKRMFESDFREKESNIVNLPDEYDDLVELLVLMYGTGNRDIDSSMARRILPLVHKYLITKFMDTVERTISYSMTDSTAPECLLLAEQFGLKQMRQSALDACAKWDINKLNQLVEEYKIPLDIKAEIYQRRIEILEKCIGDVQRSFTHSCVRMESKLERVPANHCVEHQRPLTVVELARTETAELPIITEDVPRAQENNEQLATRYNVSASIRPAAGMLGTIEERALNTMSGTTAANTPRIIPAPVEKNNPPVVCEKCVENFKDHINELCQRAMHKVPIVLYKPNR